MNIDDLTIREAKELARMFNNSDNLGAAAWKADTYCGIPEPAPIFENPVVAHFIGRFVFVCNLEIKGNYCYLTNVRNVRYWEKRENGLGDLAVQGKKDGDYIDDWPDQIIPIDKLGPVMPANKDKWS